jgi:hypothetical protein
LARSPPNKSLHIFAGRVLKFPTLGAVFSFVHVARTPSEGDGQSSQVRQPRGWRSDDGFPAPDVQLLCGFSVLSEMQNQMLCRPFENNRAMLHTDYSRVATESSSIAHRRRRGAKRSRAPMLCLGRRLVVVAG